MQALDAPNVSLGAHGRARHGSCRGCPGSAGRAWRRGRFGPLGAVPPAPSNDRLSRAASASRAFLSVALGIRLLTQVRDAQARLAIVAFISATLGIGVAAGLAEGVRGRAAPSPLRERRQ